MLGDLLGSLGQTTGNAARRIGIPVPGGRADNSRLEQWLAQTSNTEVGADVTPCPVTLVVTTETRAGAVPVKGVTVSVDGTRLGVTTEKGELRGTASACNGALRLKAVYENSDRRVKREEFTLEITGIDAQAKRATGGAARNFISKVQDVFGSGEGGFPGDKDFTDSYAGSDLVTVGPGGIFEIHVRVKLATLSLTVPYRNQNDRSDSINGVASSGSILCMPSSAEMQARYWNIQKTETDKAGKVTRTAMDRLDIMQRSYARAPKTFSLSAFPRPWQDWGNLRGAMKDLADASNPSSFTVGNGPAGADVETIPGPYADALTELAARGVPAVTSTYATDGHVMIVIGAVVKHDGHSEWLILNDPNGTLASTDSIYGTLKLTGSVGLNGANAAADVRAVQEVLIRTGEYTGAPGAAINSADPNDPTIAAIRKFQGKNGDGVISPGGGTEARMNARVGEGARPTYSAAENERNGPTGDRGRHVYYNGDTSGAYSNTAKKIVNKFRLKGQAWTSVVEPVTALTKEQIAQRLDPGVPRAEPPASGQ
ncbi:hypothetical protein JCM7686_0146 [Paracoccus aminophilus JCM 7686]|uniref:Uncharacterized protein n=2 Tax=Paracoccus aminophilus TaxID=34003 RepID=S5XQC8_PARAH|nr:hypothetical protein JCM7686_0146 [Paracoccus aminophilus JCM 7686]